MNNSIHSKIGFLICICCVFSPPLYAQIVITQQHLPSSGDTIRYSNANTLEAPEPGSSGANIHWDFRDLVPVSQDRYDYRASQQTPYILNFGFNAIGLKVADSLGQGPIQLSEVYNFFRKSSSSWSNVGIGFRYSSFPLPQSGKHDDPDEVYVLPLRFEDSTTNTFSVRVPITVGFFPIGNYFQTGTRTTVVDGWGIISTPYADSVPCLRLKSTLRQFDSVAISQPALNFGFPNTRVEYKWLSTTEKIPLLEISGAEINGNFTPALVRFRDNFRDLSSPLEPEADFSVNKTLIQEGETVYFTDESSRFPSSWEWSISPSAGNAWEFVENTDEWSQNPAVRFNAAGNYSVTLQAANFFGESSHTETDVIRVQQTNTTGASLVKEALHIYPNPSSGQFTVQLPGKEGTLLRITDMQGRLFYETSTKQNEMVIACEKWSKGAYLIEVVQKHNRISGLVFIK